MAYFIFLANALGKEMVENSALFENFGPYDNSEQHQLTEITSYMQP